MDIFLESEPEHLAPHNSSPMKVNHTTLSILALCAASGNAAVIWNLGDANFGRVVPESASLYGAAYTVDFVQESAVNPLPGDPNSPAVNQQADDDYYFAGVYSNQVDGGPAYTTVGPVGTSEVAVERAITSGDGNLRYHFNLDASTAGTDLVTLTFQMLDLDDNNTGTGIFNIDAFMNGVPIGTFEHNAGSIPTIETPDKSFSTFPIAISTLNGTGGAADDNYVELRSSTGGSTARWANVDYVQLDVSPAVPEPSALALLVLAGAGMFRRRR
jgi:hypothetical protein